MPREIIDTQSSRPRYVRRMVFSTVGLLVVAAIVIFVAVAVFGHFGHAAIPGK